MFQYNENIVAFININEKKNCVLRIFLSSLRAARWGKPNDDNRLRRGRIVLKFYDDDDEY